MAIKNNINVEVVNSQNASYQEVEKVSAAESLENLEFQKEDDSAPEYDNRAFDVHNPSDSPYVTIAKIVLEPTGGDIMPENNPHIDDVDAANILIDEYGNVQFVSKGVDYLTRTVSASGLLVNLQLSIKEIIKSNDVLFKRHTGETIVVTGKPGTGTWYDNPEYLKYLRIRVVESTHPDLTSKLKNGEYGLDPKDIASTGFRKYAREKIISIDNEISKDINEYESFRNAEGQRIYDVTFNVSYFHNTRDPKHLSYFVQTFLDVEQISADFGCGSGNLQALGLDKQTGPIAAEQVINNSGTSQNSFAFYTPENKIWIGPVHYHPTKGFMAGSTHTKKPHSALRRAVVKNNKIKDLRDSGDLERAEIEFTVIENELLDLKLTSLERSVADVKRMTEYFSDLFGTRDRDGRFRAVFGLNYQKILQDKTEFGKMFTNSNLSVVEGLTNSCKISLVKITRERVEDLETLTSIGTVVHGRTPFGTNELGVVTNSQPKKTIVYSSAGNIDNSRLATYTRRVTSTGQAVETTEKNRTIQGGLTVDGFIKEVELFPTIEKDIRHFAFADYEVSKATDGLYRYGIEITIEDGTKDYLTSLSKRLLTAKKSLLLYYNEASGRTNGKRNYNSKNRKYTQSFINLKNLQYPTPNNGKIRAQTEVIYHPTSGEKAPRNIRDHNHNFIVDAKGNGRTSTVDGHYHEVGSFKLGPAIPKSKKRKFIKGTHIHASFLRGHHLSAPWSAPIRTYLDILDIFSSGRHNIEIIKLHSMLFKMLAPESGSPEGILRLVKLIDNLYAKIDNVTGDPKTIGRRASPKTASPDRRIIKFEKMFDQIFDSNVPKHTGFDYLGTQETSLMDNGLYMVDGRTYVQRAIQETAKYDYQSLGAAANELSFLGPASAEITGIVSLNFLANIFDNLPAVAELEAKILQFNLSPERAPMISSIGLTEDDSTLNLQKSTESFFNGFNVTVADITDKSTQGSVSFYPFQLQRCLENVKTYLGDDSLMIRKDLNVESLVNPGGSTPKGLVITAAKSSNNTLNLVSAKIKNSSYNPLLLNKNPFASATPTFNIGNFEMAVPNSYHKLGQAEISTLPNQLKSLFSPNNFLSNKYKETEGTEEQAQMESALRINMELLKYVEVFTGYYIKSNGTKLIKYPQWEQLEYNTYNSGVGKVLLCRLTNYSSSKVNSAYRELLSLPAYNSYFFLSPTSPETSAGTGQMQNPLSQYRDNIARRNRSNRSMMEESIKIKSVPANRIHSNMLVLAPVEGELPAVPLETPAGTGESVSAPMGSGGGTTGGGGMGGY
ncbi:hypothetical protein [uncultured Mediterranean phage]|nr:hypothetical protein [uncultured Mediterranean phage]